MKHWRVKISQIEEKVFANTQLVDKDSLYNVDMESYNREVLKITKENEDLIESGSPLKGKKQESAISKKKASPVKKKKGGKGKKGDE